MKYNLFKIYLLSFFLLTDFILFAQGPGFDDGSGGLEGDDGPGFDDGSGCLECPDTAPINTKIVWLIIAAIAFAFYSYKNKRKEA